MNARTALRLCHAGMEARALDAFEIFLSRVEPFACRITSEDDADAAFIDADSDIGSYLLQGHRMRYPGRPLIVTCSRPSTSNDPLTIQITKPVGLAAFSAALNKVHTLLPRTRASGQMSAANLGDMPDDTPLSGLFELPPEPPAKAHKAAPLDPIGRLRQIEERLTSHYVGTLADVDLDNLRQLDTIYYTPEHFLQGAVAQALAQARASGRPVKLVSPCETIAFLDPRGESAYQPLTTNGMRAQAQLPTRGTVHCAAVGPSDASLLSRLNARPLQALQWELALWASRGRLPAGTSLDTPLRLTRWPNLTRCATPPEAMRIAGLWSRNAISLRETVKTLAVPQRYVFAFYSACVALDLIEEVRSSVAPQPPVEVAPPPLRSLFKRFLGKLLGTRLGEDAGVVHA